MKNDHDYDAGDEEGAARRLRGIALQDALSVDLISAYAGGLAVD